MSDDFSRIQNISYNLEQEFKASLAPVTTGYTPADINVYTNT